MLSAKPRNRSLVALLLGLAACDPSLGGGQGDPRYWREEGGELIGSTDGHPPLTENSFYAWDGNYADFELTMQFKIRNGNSGIQFRSESLPNYVVRGYQGDISDAADGHLGILYEERGRGFLGDMTIAGVYDHLDPAGWNDYRIVAEGTHIVLAVNGFTTVDYVESDGNARRSGVIAVQVHVGAPMEVRFRNMRIVVR